MRYSINYLLRGWRGRPNDGQPPCNICGYNKFKIGPGGRKGEAGRLPRCTSCRSVERHRIVHSIWTPLVGEELRRLRAIQFSRDPSVEKKWFKSLEISIYGKRNSLDLESIERPSDCYDVAVCNHVLEHIENDRQAFREIMRILTPTGIFQFTVPLPHSHSVTDDWGYPDEAQAHYRMYGKDLVDRFSKAQPDVKFLCVEGFDDVTGVGDIVYFCSLDDQRLWEMQRVLKDVFESIEAVI